MRECGSSGRCAMAAERRPVPIRVRLVLGGLLAGLSWPALAAQAPPAAPAPVPVRAEVPQQDLDPPEERKLPMDEAVFTDISPLTVPEVGVRLPEDQQY